MEDNKLAARIRPLEAFAAENPALYRFRVALVALLGYAYLLLIVTLLLALVAFLVLYTRLNFLTILWIPLVLAGLVLRALWITIPEPDGKELQREQAPALFDLIHEVSEKLQAPKVHHVFVSDEVNASIIQIPQFGMFGWLRNYLVVGLPLLRALTPDEFRAVLAHEFGHLSGKHGRFTGWIYRVRQTWIQILTQVHQERRYASFLFEPFLNWYAPFLNAYSFVLARTQEREADAYAVEFAGKEFAAQSLIRLATKDRVLSEVFWPTFLNGAKEQALAPRDTFTQMLAGMDQPIGQAKAQKWFLDELRVKTDYEDTHPALGDRLTAMGFQKDGPELANLVNAMVNGGEAPKSAASRYLRELPQEFEPGMNRLWRERIAQIWRDRHEQFQKAGKQFDELEEQAKTRVLTVEEQWERIVTMVQVRDWESTLPDVRALLEQDPEHVNANFALGSYLLEQGDKEGIEYLEKATATGAELAGDACQRISGFYLAQGDHEEANVYRKRADEYVDQARRIQVQVFSFSANDKFDPHDLDEDRIKELKDQLENVRGLEAAYLFRKILSGPSDPSIYILAFATQATWQNGEHAKHVNVVVEELSKKVTLPSPYMMISLDGQYFSLLHRVNSIPGARLFAVPEHGVTYIG